MFSTHSSHEVQRYTKLALAFMLAALLALMVPSLAFGLTPVVNPNPVPTPEDFPTARGCSCHRELLNQWSDSMHAKALSDPFYLDQVEEARKDGGDELAAFCDTCHAPGAIMTGSIDNAKEHEGLDGITCTICHQVEGQYGDVIGNTSMGYPNGGPNGTYYAHLKDPAAPHKAAYNSFFETSEFCGTCHNVIHPGNGMLLEATYTEWKESSYAKEGITCQRCHNFKDVSMEAPYSATVGLGGPTRDNVFAMTFVGGNVEQSNKELATALLKSAAEMKIDFDGKDIIPNGKTEKLTVNITNVGAGHDLPTGLTEVRNVWLSVYAADVDGNKQAEITTVPFGVKLAGADGQDVGARFWLGETVLEDRRIKAGETYSEDVEFTMPEGVDTSYLVAELNYQSAKDEVIAPSGVKNPTTIMASAEQGFFTSEEAKKAAEAKKNKQQKQEDSGALLLPDDEPKASTAVIVAAIIVGLVAGGVGIAAIMRAKKKKAAEATDAKENATAVEETKDTEN